MAASDSSSFADQFCRGEVDCVQGLPAGEYFAVAIPDRLAADWQNPAFLASLTAGAERARVRDGERLAVSLKMAR